MFRSEQLADLLEAEIAAALAKLQAAGEADDDEEVDDVFTLVPRPGESLGDGGNMRMVRFEPVD